MAASESRLDVSLLKTYLNCSEIKQRAQRLTSRSRSLSSADGLKLKDLLLAVRCIDLTTLAGDDSYSNVARLCCRAASPLSRLHGVGGGGVGGSSRLTTTVGAVCVYPSRVRDCKQVFEKILDNRKMLMIPIASVVAGFPAGQGPVTSTLNEIEFATDSGANEIDIVIDRSLVITGQWEKLFRYIKIIVAVCRQRQVHLKVILSCGELGTLQNIYKASMCAMAAGADFIKTSTGKESINAKLVYGIVMCRAIREFHRRTGRAVGLKPAGGIKTANDALAWIELVRQELGPEWLNPERFRIGASSLLDNLETEIQTILDNQTFY